MYIFSGLKKKRIGTRVGCTGFNLFCIVSHANRVKIQANTDFLKKEFLFPFADIQQKEISSGCQPLPLSAGGTYCAVACLSMMVAPFPLSWVSAV